MKRKGNISHTYLRRDKVILPELYIRAKRQAEYPVSLDKICSIMASLPVDRYYITDDAALSYIRKRFLHGEIPKFRTPERQRLYESLYEEVKEMMKDEKYRNTGMANVTVMALMRPAPCVGLSPKKLYRFHSRIKKHISEKGHD